jgi:hypothetical protein
LAFLKSCKQCIFQGGYNRQQERLNKVINCLFSVRTGACTAKQPNFFNCPRKSIGLDKLGNFPQSLFVFRGKVYTNILDQPPKNIKPSASAYKVKNQYLIIK